MMDSVKYLKLTDLAHKGEIVKQEGRKFFGFVDGVWKRRALGIEYYYPDAPEFGCFEYISEQEALKSLNIN